ncbi:transcriptional repressor LexA [Olsenella sp. DSM 107455]|uniref:LexA repressor n=1 Tax=Thermophilibacter gallinarum TaxID=2779357 RepID=A0ABR9QU89_9ACTN|nr:transcriptional repressor LexA [Thermophilibacter gallinarum]MBE5024645.1 transcriptional repressor LexA [Thermophilibacter gallinarum]
MAKGKLGKRQLAIYDFIRSYSDEHGYPPSVREIGSAVGLASPSTVHMHLKVLEEQGLIKRDSKKPRTIEVMGKQEEPASDLASVSQDPNDNVIRLPLVGRVAAGVPILAEQNVEETLALPTSIVGDASSFILRVRGESMVNAGIFDGDYIVVKEQQDAHDGEIVVALIDDSATVKTFYREKDRVRLQPENDTMAPIYVENPVILGRVTALIRSVS